MKTERKVLQCSLNMDDRFEKSLHDHAISQGSMSKYLKRLIFLDKEAKLGAVSPTIPQSLEEDDFLAQKKEDAINSITL